MRYQRSLTKEFFAALCTSGPMCSLISEYRACNPADTYAFDLHFRENDQLMLYLGTGATRHPHPRGLAWLFIP